MWRVGFFMIYWSNDDGYEIIESESISSLAEKYGVKLEYGGCKLTRDWFNYAHIVSAKYGFNVVYEACFTYYVTLYLAGEGISVGAEEEYFVKRLDKVVYGIYNDSLLKSDAQYQKVFFFNSLVDLFRGDEIRRLEKRIFQHNVRVSGEIKDWFKSFDNYRMVISSLLYGEMEKPHLNMNTGSSSSVVFVLTYSEEVLWRGLSPFGDRDRMRVLLY